MTDDFEDIIADPLRSYSEGVISSDVAATLLEVDDKDALSRELHYAELPEPPDSKATEDEDTVFRP